MLSLFLLLVTLHKRFPIRVTSHTRVRARDYSASSTLIGGKGRVGPSSLHIRLEGPMEHVNAQWM